jgi:cellulose synthase/poly-beta-1,6-N-acetylglucosamine synthase-like glycosyltransferase
MDFLAISALALHLGVLVLLAVYGLHRYMMVYLYYRYRHRQPRIDRKLATLPRVTVQLPVFNEVYVIERLIDAVARLDYPRHLLEIQVLDDSTDETAEVARRKVEEYRLRGLNIHHHHRIDRVGYKAGALAAGLESAQGEFIAIFDADFVPKSDFLLETIHYFAEPDVGMVQARWGHLNGGYSLLTRIQSIMLDGHFVVEHAARNRAKRFFNFNGTAGIWRRRTIEEAGGWQHDTLTEDLDLSYRAQLQGWRFLFLSDVVSPAEVPVEMNAFKNQQYRWSKGSIQTARKLLPRILSRPLPFAVKVEAVFHLTANVAYPLMVLLSVLMFPTMWIRYNLGWSGMQLIDIPLFLAATASVSSFYVVSQWEAYSDWKQRILAVPFLMSVGIGLSLNNARAVVGALTDNDVRFVRTPKLGIESSSDVWQLKKYRGRRGFMPIVEIGLGLYLTAAALYAAFHQIVGILPFLVLFQLGFLYSGFLSLTQGSRSMKPLLRNQRSLPKVA